MSAHDERHKPTYFLLATHGLRLLRSTRFVSELFTKWKRGHIENAFNDVSCESSCRLCHDRCPQSVTKIAPRKQIHGGYRSSPSNIENGFLIILQFICILKTFFLGRGVVPFEIITFLFTKKERSFWEFFLFPYQKIGIKQLTTTLGHRYSNG